jgi:hypothetical protein
MPPAYYPQRRGDYVYDVTVTTDDSVELSRRYRARLSNAERLEAGRLTPVPVNVPDTYGPTVAEAIRALNVSFDAWCQEHLANPSGRESGLRR